jgi:hypothetical protein
MSGHMNGSPGADYLGKSAPEQVNIRTSLRTEFGL